MLKIIGLFKPVNAILAFRIVGLDIAGVDGQQFFQIGWRYVILTVIVNRCQN
jgi:hypothetical protein